MACATPAGFIPGSAKIGQDVELPNAVPDRLGHWLFCRNTPYAELGNGYFAV